MAEELDTVNPGDVVSSQFMNRVIENINTTNEKLKGIDDLLPGPGKVTVPNVFGLSLELAKAELTRPSTGLLLGNVYNAIGVRIFPEDNQALILPVLNQTPEADKIVAIGTAVNLLIAAKSTANGNGGADLEITGINPPDGADVTQDIEIVGKNYLLPFNRNIVFFDGAFEAEPKAGSTDKSLIVSVPEGIPNLPRSVSVAVQAEGITRVYDQPYLIRPKTSDTISITRSIPAINAEEKIDLVLVGTGFTDNASENKITFIYNPNLPEPRPKVEVDGKSVETKADGMHLTVRIPDFTNNCPNLPNDCPNMVPAGTGTRYNITVHKASDPSKKATHGINIFPAPV